MTDDNNVNLFNNRSINNSVNSNVHDLLKLDSGIRNNSEVEVRSKANSGMEVRNGFDPEVSDSLRPNGSTETRLREWEKNVLMHLNNVNLVERGNRKTSYVKFKLFKRDTCSLALVDTGNLVKGTLVSSEF